MKNERKMVTIRTISKIEPIEGADKIEVATIDGWKVVVEKNKFKKDQFVLYYEIDSFLPVKPEYDFLLRGSKPKKMISEGKEIEGIRLKTIKLRGQISQGLALPLTEEMKDLEVGTDVSEMLGVIKYEAPIPSELQGKVKGSFPGFIPKTDEERIQNMSEVLTNFYVTEKLDGTSVTYYKKDGQFGVCTRNLELAEGETTQWKKAAELDLANKLPDNFAIQCELVGEGIQKNPLKLKGHEIFCFNVYNIISGIYLNYEDFIGFCSSLGIKTVPVISDNFSLPNSVDEMLSFSEGKSLLNPNAEREGIVIKPKIEMQYKGQRLSFKAISNKYLLKVEE